MSPTIFLLVGAFIWFLLCLLTLYFFLFTSGIQDYTWLIWMANQPCPTINPHWPMWINQDGAWPDRKRAQQAWWTNHTAASGNFFHPHIVSSPRRNRPQAHYEWPSTYNRRAVALWAIINTLLDHTLACLYLTIVFKFCILQEIMRKS